MPHESQLAKKKYRNWVQAGLGLMYVKQGLQSFCEDIAKQHHSDIINDIKQKNNLSTVTCGQCNVKDLMPDHIKVGNRQCPLGQMNCNCWFPTAKITCPNNVCGAIYDQIIKSHGSTPPSPYWKNSDIQKWCTDPWSIAKCFINTPGYDRKSPADTDCTGLLHLIIHNKVIHNHLCCNITGKDVFSVVKDYRNNIFHSGTMELDDTDVKAYIVDMIAVLEDDLELKNRHDSQMAVKNLKELTETDFVITTQNEAEVCRNAMQATKQKQQALEEMIQNAKEDIKLKKTEAIDDLDMKKLDISGRLNQEWNRSKNEIKEAIEVFEKKTKETLEASATKDDIACLDSRLTAFGTEQSEQKQILESLQKDSLKEESELNCLQKVLSGQREQSDYVESKLDFQKRLMRFYKEKVLKVSPMPMQPEGNKTEVADVYVKPRMTVRRNVNDKSARLTDVKLTSMSEIFAKDGKHFNSVYVVGETGTGKSFFSKSLVHFWCLAHADNLSTKYSSDSVKEMRKFEFLFHISLRHYSSTSTVKEMLEEEYCHPTLATILDKESGNCLIVLDGLDEWAPQKKTPQTKGFPKRDFSKDYTVITTSRPWKIETLQQSDATEIKQRIELLSIDSGARMAMITKTLSILNETFGEDKYEFDCFRELEETQVSDIMQVPIVLQQLVCLWFDGKLSGTSLCAIYSGMLDLFFSWSSKRIPGDPDLETMRKSSDVLSDVGLPQHLGHLEHCKSYTFFIYNISHLAFATLMNERKEASLTFDSSTMEKLGINDEVKRCCLKLGILTEDSSTSLSASRLRKSLFSFVYKSLQEFLAAVYVAVNFNSLTRALQQTQSTIKSENCKQFVHTYFSKIGMIEDILEHANVFIFLCGLEPRLATSISEYVYNIIMVDDRTVEYRTKVPDTFKYLLSDIQHCIYRCMKEVLANEINFHPQFFLGDVITDDEKSCRFFTTALSKEYIIVDSILSFYCNDLGGDSFSHYINPVFKNLTKCQRLTSIKLNDDGFGSMSLYNVNFVIETLKANVSTLQTVSFYGEIIRLYHVSENRFIDDVCDKEYMGDVGMYAACSYEEVITSCISLLSKMNNLGALKIEQYLYYLKPELHRSLCNFICETKRLKQISLMQDYSQIDLPRVYLSQHQQLQCLELRNITDIMCVNTDNLEKFLFHNVSDSNFNVLFDIIHNSFKLTSLDLECCTLSDVESVTNELRTTLSSLSQLQKLRLKGFTFTDNIFVQPLEMKRLHSVYLNLVSMSTSTWYKVIDSLPMLPNQVQVIVWPHCIIAGKCRTFIYPSGQRAKHEFEAAFQYVKEKPELFSVIYYGNTVTFTTKK